MRVETFNLWLGVVVAGLTIIGTLSGAAWFFLKLWIRPLEAKIESLEKALTEKLSEVEEQIEKIDERQRRHTGDPAKHVSDQWRLEQQRQWDALGKRLDRIEEGLLKLLGGK